MDLLLNGVYRAQAQGPRGLRARESFSLSSFCYFLSFLVKLHSCQQQNPQSPVSGVRNHLLTLCVPVVPVETQVNVASRRISYHAVGVNRELCIVSRCRRI